MGVVNRSTPDAPDRWGGLWRPDYLALECQRALDVIAALQAGTEVDVTDDVASVRFALDGYWARRAAERLVA